MSEENVILVCGWALNLGIFSLGLNHKYFYDNANYWSSLVRSENIHFGHDKQAEHNVLGSLHYCKMYLKQTNITSASIWAYQLACLPPYVGLQQVKTKASACAEDIPHHQIFSHHLLYNSLGRTQIKSYTQNTTTFSVKMSLP